jgi:hypothetical protein
MANARSVLKQIEEWEVTKFWTGYAYVWVVPDLDESSCSTDLIFDNQADAVAYIDALHAVVATSQAAITLPREVLDKLDAIQCEKFWARMAREGADL